ncbi:MAG: HNH endonuclease family protein [Senegalia sp. (in: firmicutes)]
MDIKRNIIKVSDLIEGYVDLGNDGVIGYGGKLDIRPPYQREFIYDDARQEAVIDSVTSHFPLGIMYWVDREDGTYEVLDGQQRIISICKFYNRDFSLKSGNTPIYFHGLTSEEKKQFLNYELDVYVCSGTEREKLEWFKRINVVGIELSNQELRNAAYTGPWLSSSKSYFSKNNAPVDEYNKYMSGKKNRQEWLETALEWKSHADYGRSNVEQYMAEHQQDKNAEELWQYFFIVMNWLEMIFKKYRSQMKGIEWGVLYNEHKDQVRTLNSDQVEEDISYLIQHDDIKNKKGIYSYIFDRDEKHLNLRTFDTKQRAEAYERQNGRCNMCGEKFAIEEMHADHIVPFSKGGLTESDNCQMLCAKDNWAKAAR